jgi:tRNA threonylcarbamoyladenosine biosynthesis protein TsaB
VIVAFSTSSPLASVALIDASGDVIASGEEWAPRAASGACLSLLTLLLREAKRDLAEAGLFVSDLGPGSFTGVKVGVTLAKTLAFSFGKKASGLQSFDLIDPRGLVVIPSKRDEWFVRDTGSEITRGKSLPTLEFKGYGTGIENPAYPRAAMFAIQLERLKNVRPEELLPDYLIDPSISQPTKPFQKSVPM